MFYSFSAPFIFFLSSLAIQQVFSADWRDEYNIIVPRSKSFYEENSLDVGEEDFNTNVFLKKLLSNPNFRQLADECENNRTRPKCDASSPYRTFDGSCNNLKHPTWGMVDDCLLRILPAAYEGRKGIRRSVTGEPLPQPRQLSQRIFSGAVRPTPKINFMFTVYGQALAHDQSLGSPAVGPNLFWKFGISCCAPFANANSECLPIIIPLNDPFYSKHQKTCINFRRGNACSSCKDNGKRQIANIVTAAIDAHLVYGLNKELSNELRTNDGTGRLKFHKTDGGEELFQLNDERNFTLFCPPMDYQNCFRAGDGRVNQHSFLVSIHVLLMREHNRIAVHLKRINPHWEEEILFQTARKILCAKFQVLVFNEYLPLLLGRRYMAKFGLLVRKDGKGTHYDPTLRFGIWQEFSSGAFRLHSMVPKDTGYEEFRNMYHNPYPILGGNLSRIVKGSCLRPSKQFDYSQVDDVTNFSLRVPGDDFGLDGVSIDILRGRDYGLPSYIDVLNYCSITNKKVTSFDDLVQVMPYENIELLKQNYRDVRDIDFYVGMHMETLMEGSVLPPTCACIIAGQFYFQKYGDRFYFEHINETGSFTDAQRESLKKFTLNRLICENTKVKELPKNAFELSEIVSCDSGKENDVDLNLWKA